MIPIRKIDPYTVALTSYYGKTFVTRNQLRSNNSLAYINKKLNEAIVSEQPYIKNVLPAKVFNNNFEAPYIYNAIADNYKGFTVEDKIFIFDYTDRETIVDKDKLPLIEKDGKLVCGYNTKSEPIVVDTNNEFFLYSKNIFMPLGDIFSILKLDANDAPIDFSEVRIFSKTIPVGVVLGYFIGFNGLIKLLDAKYRVVEGRRNKELSQDEYAITFKDISYIFSRKDNYNSLILAGYLYFEKEIKKYEASMFNQKDVYFNIFESKSLTSVYLRELNNTDKLFIDSITKSILEDMGEPLTFKGLLIRATEMLMTYHHPDSQDMKYMRIRGYERIAGSIYKALSSSVRQFVNKNIAGKSKIDMSPFEVWQSIMKDPAIKLVEDINPLQNIKEVEIVTYVGEGGRAKESMNKSSRAFHINDVGVMSEGTVASSDVGINAYLTANPNFKNLRGIIKENREFNPANLVSSVAMTAPASHNDDPKRVNFVHIQSSHVIASDGYRQPYIRTGYEYIIPYRVSKMFACGAKRSGKVISKNNNGIIIEYDNAEKEGVQLGRIHGKAEGSIYPHDIVTHLNEGDKVKKGDIIAYNNGFFEQDILDPKAIIMKSAMNVKTVLYESNQTHEDASAISTKVSSTLSSRSTKVKSITVQFTQNLLNVVKVGQQLQPKDHLMIIEDNITSTTNAFDTDTLAMLKNLSNQAPKAKYIGVVDKIEVFYHGEKEDMSSSLRTLADASDKLLSSSRRASNQPVISGQVNSEYRVSGKPLSLNSAEIKIYITIESTSGIGDKGIYANQLKSVFSEVMENKVTTESGEEIDAIFGYRSVMARIVLSPVIIGTTITLLDIIAKKAVKVYKGQT